MKKLSIRYRIIFALLVIPLPFILLFQIYTESVIENMNLQLLKGYSDTLEVFCTAVEKELMNADALLAIDCWSN